MLNLTAVRVFAADISLVGAVISSSWMACSFLPDVWTELFFLPGGWREFSLRLTCFFRTDFLLFIRTLLP